MKCYTPPSISQASRSARAFRKKPVSVASTKFSFQLTNESLNA